MSPVKALLFALLVCALTAVASGVFGRGNPMLTGLIIAAGVGIALFAYHLCRRRTDR